MIRIGLVRLTPQQWSKVGRGITNNGVSANSELTNSTFLDFKHENESNPKISGLKELMHWEFFSRPHGHFNYYLARNFWQI